MIVRAGALVIFEPCRFARGGIFNDVDASGDCLCAQCESQSISLNTYSRAAKRVTITEKKELQFDDLLYLELADVLAESMEFHEDIPRSKRPMLFRRALHACLKDNELTAPAVEK